MNVKTVVFLCILTPGIALFFLNMYFQTYWNRKHKRNTQAIYGFGGLWCMFAGISFGGWPWIPLIFIDWLTVDAIHRLFSHSENKDP